MRKLYFGLSALLVVAVAVQFYLAAVGAFDPAHDDNSFMLHRGNAMAIIAPISLLATIAAAMAKAPRPLILRTSVPLLLIVFQVVLTEVGKSIEGKAGLVLLGFHALVGMAVFGSSAYVFSQARQRVRKA